MDLGQVRSFVEVAERGTIAAAAVALDFTPPAISQHLAKLEVEVGAQLFDRAGRRLRLTSAGAALLPVAQQMIDLDFQGRQVVGRQPERPHYLVAGFASAIATVLIPCLAGLDDEMTITVSEREDAEALRDLRVGEVDLVLTQEYDGFPVLRDPRLVFTPIVSDRLRLVVPVTLDRATTVTDLIDTPWLVNGHGTRCSAATTRILEAEGMSPRISGTIADNDTLLALVAAGHGVTVVPELILPDHRPGITVADQDLGVVRTILAVHRAVAGAAIAPLLDRLLQEVGSLG